MTSGEGKSTIDSVAEVSFAFLTLPVEVPHSWTNQQLLVMGHWGSFFTCINNGLGRIREREGQHPSHGFKPFLGP